MHAKMRRVSLSLTLAALLAAVTLSLPANAGAPLPPAISAAQTALPELTGAYRIASATDPSGSAYTGTARVARVGGAYRVTWNVSNNSSPDYEGVGLQVGDTLGVGWGQRGGRYGVSVYRINGGRLAGRWTESAQNGATWVEELTGPASLSGTYRITRATSPQDSGGSYTGTVEITPRGEVYLARWRIASGESYSGVGLRQGDLLVVGWGTGQNVSSVAVYQARGTMLQGRWAVPNETRTGTENFTRQ